jgi:hypothetical protein
VPEVLVSKVVPPDEVTMVPAVPTPTNNPLEVVVVVVLSLVVDAPSSLLLLHEIMVRLKRNREKMMSICLTWFPISGLGEPEI